MEKKSLITRTRRVRGQIEGIERMIEKTKECEDILIQVKAAQKALLKLGEVMMKCSIDECLRTEKSHEKIKKRVGSLVSAALKM